MKIKFSRDKVLLFCIAFLIVAIDQVVKFVIQHFFEVFDTVPVIQDFFYLTYTQNTGAAYSILEGNQMFLILMGLFFSIFFVYFIFSREERLSKLSLISYSFLMGGVIGNLIDRIVHHYVIDFLSFHFFSYYFPIFNIADIFIVIGFLLIVLEEVLGKYDENSCRRRRFRKNR
ncbi:MAG: signal peptidase II [Bacilli bacterium]|nr:signal peptidase II [Bacilli bacterium]